jgi:hypothetical protein
MKQAVDGLMKLGWVRKHKGYITDDGAKVLTTLVPKGELLASFKQRGILWQKLIFDSNKQSLYLRIKELKKKKVDGKIKTVSEVINLPIKNTPEVRRMRSNLKRINEHISSQAICLHMLNDSLNGLAKEIAKKNNPTVSFFGEPKKKGRHMNFYDVHLYRVFSEGSMQRGGRFYGGWWQIIPSRFRPYITINGLGTYEVDYSEFHPRMLYALNGLEPPEGDLYDFKHRIPGYPHWSPEVEPYKILRRISKEFLNAYLNDPKGKHRLEAKDCKALGLSTRQLMAIMLERHPILEVSQGVGLDLQYLDSQIAEYVMMDLLKDEITCLPVHDSFIVQRHHLARLQETMTRAYQHFVPGMAKQKFEPADHTSEFQMTFLPDGELDRKAMFAMHESAIHNIYVQSWRGRHRPRTI